MLEIIPFVVACLMAAAATILIPSSMEYYLRRASDRYPPDAISLYVLCTFATLTLGMFAEKEGLRQIPKVTWQQKWHWLFTPIELVLFAVLAFTPDRWTVYGCACLVRFPGQIAAWVAHQPADKELRRRIVTAVLVSAFIGTVEIGHGAFYGAIVAVPDFDNVSEPLRWLALFALAAGSFAIRFTMRAFLASVLIITRRRRSRPGQKSHFRAAAVLKGTAAFDHIDAPADKQANSTTTSVSVLHQELSPKEQFKEKLSLVLPILISECGHGFLPRGMPSQ
ncbi:hypothetical protein DFJ73DRAFT_570425 [Zopfochytrium polystomum]|nr:hypothetical protein DFJ73DRAFT_570425 [Zopfochytrium polystomum]